MDGHGRIHDCAQGARAQCPHIKGAPTKKSLGVWEKVNLIQNINKNKNKKQIKLNKKRIYKWTIYSFPNQRFSAVAYRFLVRFVVY